MIGGNERYVSVCRKHYKEAITDGLANGDSRHDNSKSRLNIAVRHKKTRHEGGFFHQAVN